MPKTVLIVSKHPPGKGKEPGGVFTHQMLLEDMLGDLGWASDFHSVASARELPGLRRRASRGVDVVYLNASLSALGTLKVAGMLLFLRGTRAGVIVQSHGGRPSNLPFFSAWRPFLRAAFRRADCVLALTEDQERDFLRMGLDRSRVRRSINTLPRRREDLSSPRTGETSNTTSVLGGNGMGCKRFRFLFLGRIVREKGILEIVEAARALREHQPAFEVVFAGSGSDEALLQRVSEDVPEISVVGPRFGPSKAEVLGTAHALLLPTYHQEGLPYAILEAMERGLPTIASNAGGLSALVRPGETGLLVPPRDPRKLAAAMRHFVENPEEVARMGKAARALVEKEYSFQEGVRQLRLNLELVSVGASAGPLS